MGLDLVGSRLAVSWVYHPGRCLAHGDSRFTATGSEIWSLLIGQGRRLIARACNFDPLSEVYSATMSSRRLSFVRRTTQDEQAGFAIHSVDLSSGAESSFEGIETVAAAADAQRLYEVRRMTSDAGRTRYVIVAR